jgi:putative transposase
VDLQEVVNAIFYIVQSGCSWRMLPHDFPKWSTVYGYFNRWSHNGLWERINLCLVYRVRRKLGRKKHPTAGIIDSQSVKHTAIGSEACGYDAGKKVKGIKRFILTDSQGLILVAMVCSAAISERSGAMHLIRRVYGSNLFKNIKKYIKLVWVDGGYRGQFLATYAKVMLQWIFQVVLRKETEKEFQVLPRRWVVERSFAWLNHARRLSKNYEFKTKHSQSMIYVASIRLMLRRL